VVVHELSKCLFKRALGFVEELDSIMELASRSSGEQENFVGTFDERFLLGPLFADSFDLLKDFVVFEP
jgi:hypothetical protein